MKNKSELNEMAEKWSDAYRGDYNGRGVSIKIIAALLDFGFTEWEAEQVYRSKNIRWFFDSQDDKVLVGKAHELFTAYLQKNMVYIRAMFETEFNHKLATMKSNPASTTPVSDEFAQAYFKEHGKTMSVNRTIIAFDAIVAMELKLAKFAALEKALKACPSLVFSEPHLNNWWNQTAKPALDALTIWQNK